MHATCLKMHVDSQHAWSMHVVTIKGQYNNNITIAYTLFFFSLTGCLQGFFL